LAAPGRAEPARRTIEAWTIGSPLAVGAESTAVAAGIGPWPELWSARAEWHARSLALDFAPELADFVEQYV
jgi:hypothetical protein